MPLAALARDRGVTPQVSRVRVVVGPDVEGAAARTVTRYVLQVTGPVGETGSWVVTAARAGPLHHGGHPRRRRRPARRRRAAAGAAGLRRRPVTPGQAV